MTKHTDRASVTLSKTVLNRTGAKPVWHSRLAGLVVIAVLNSAGAAERGAATRPAGAQHALPEKRLALSVGTSITIDSPNPLTRAAVATPDVAEVTVLSPMQVLVTGKNPGMTQVIVWDKNNGQHVYNVVVEPDLTQLRGAIDQIAPGANININVVRDSLVLSGRVSDVDIADRIVNVAKIVSPNVQNQLTVAGEQQVLLRCTVAEVSKRATRKLGINGWLGGDNIRDVFAVNQVDGINPVNIGAAGGQNVIRPNGLIFTTDQNGLNLLAPPTGPELSLGFPRVQMQLFLRALRENDLLKILAEPNLVAMSGQQAKFLAGGEFPVPIPQGLGTTTIEWRRFGVLLQFTPTVIGKQMIRLRVAPEVSEPDDTRGTLIGGLPVPGLTSRSAETTVELASGTTIAIAGLLRDQVKALSKKVPALGDVPVLGALFSSVNYQKDITELVILVTPELVSGMHPDQVQSVPGQFMTEPNDFQLFGLGMIEGEPSCDDSTPGDALKTASPPRYRKFSTSPEQLSMHGPWGPADASESDVQ